MDASAQLAAEWRALLYVREVWTKEVDRLRRNLNALTDDPSMRALLDEKTRLKKEVIPRLEEEIRVRRQLDAERRNFLQQRRDAPKDWRVRERLLGRLKGCELRLRSRHSQNGVATDCDDEKWKRWDITASIDEVERRYEELRQEDEEKIRRAEREIEEATVRMEHIEDYYRRTKAGMERQVRAAEDRRNQCLRDEIEWATQSRAHLRWAQENARMDRSDLLRHYRERFPRESLCDLLPQAPIQTPSCSRPHGTRHHTRNGCAVQVREDALPAPPKPWRFFVTFSSEERGEELPRDRHQFLERLDVILSDWKHLSLCPRMVYGRLQWVIALKMTDRQRIKRVIASDPIGWKILRVGKGQRLFLEIDEKERCIRFLPRPRKKSYKWQM